MTTPTHDRAHDEEARMNVHTDHDEREALIVELRWLADRRDEYTDEQVQFQTASVRLVADILEGRNDGMGWLPSWRWDEWAERFAALEASRPSPATVEAAYEALIEHHTLDELVEYAVQQQFWCCEVGCGSGGCETCPCCSAGWCVSGRDELPDDAEDLTHWIEVAAEHNPVVARFAFPAPVVTEETVDRMARAMQVANRPDNDMLNRDQREAMEDESREAYRVLARAGLAALSPEAGR